VAQPLKPGGRVFANATTCLSLGLRRSPARYFFSAFESDFLVSSEDQLSKFLTEAIEIKQPPHKLICSRWATALISENALKAGPF
jgi:hypothetical protein